MDASFLILGTVLAGIGILVFLVLTIIALVNSQKKNIAIYASLFGVCVIIMFSCISSIFGKVSNKITNEMQEAVRESAQRYEEENVVQETERSAYSQWLKELTPEEYRDSLSGYYDTFDMDKNVNCIPMVYPYRLEMNSPEDMHAALGAVNRKKIAGQENLIAITKISFDSKMMLAKRDLADYTGRMPAGLPEVSYILFDFRTGRSQVFLNQEALLDEAEKAGFTGGLQLDPVSEVYYKL